MTDPLTVGIGVAAAAFILGLIFYFIASRDNFENVSAFISTGTGFSQFRVTNSFYDPVSTFFLSAVTVDGNPRRVW